MKTFQNLFIYSLFDKTAKLSVTATKYLKLCVTNIFCVDQTF